MANIVVGALGVQNYTSTRYGNAPDLATGFFIVALTHEVKPDKVVVLLTPEARKKNWPQLKEELHAISQAEIIEGAIVNGATDTEIWDNFDTLARCLQPGDVVSFDITNAFRSLSIVFASAITYLCQANNVQLAGIYYGAFEAIQDNIVPVFQLDLFKKLTDLTSAVGAFQRTGDIAALVTEFPDLGPSGNQLTDLFSQLAFTLDAGHVMQFMHNAAQIPERITAFEADLPLPTPFQDLLTIIAKEFAPFAFTEAQSKADIPGLLQRMLILIDWCFKRNRFSITTFLASEWLTSYAMCRNGKISEIFVYQKRNKFTSDSFAPSPKGKVSRQIQECWQVIHASRNAMAHAGFPNERETASTEYWDRSRMKAKLEHVIQEFQHMWDTSPIEHHKAGGSD